MVAYTIQIRRGVWRVIYNGNGPGTWSEYIPYIYTYITVVMYIYIYNMYTLYIQIHVGFLGPIWVTPLWFQLSSLTGSWTQAAELIQMAKHQLTRLDASWTLAGSYKLTRLPTDSSCNIDDFLHPIESAGHKIGLPTEVRIKSMCLNSFVYYLIILSSFIHIHLAR